MKKGLFITFEGSEGSGKSTQSRLLCEYLEGKGVKVVYLREPGGTEISEKIRQLLLDTKNSSMSAESEMLLYMASRAQTVTEVIKPALAQGRIVICDRFLDSTIAYQGYGLGMDKNLIATIGEFATGGIKPDLTILMDVAIRQGLKHRQFSKDRIEQRSLQYHTRVRNGYRALARREPGRIKMVRIDKDKEVTQGKIRKLVEAIVKIKCG